MDNAATSPTPDPKAKVFKGCLITLTVRDKIDPNKLPEKFTPDKMAELHQYRVANRLATELTKHFLRMEKHGDTIEMSMSITLLVDKVPGGLNHTKIIFQEYNQ
jgi:hypothetical protein